MPFTPFHFGPAMVLKAVFPAYFSLSVFILSQVLIDLEPLYFMITDDPPLHRFLHTYVGACVIFLICIVIGKPLGQLWLRLWNKTMSPGHHSRLHCNEAITFKATIISAFIGAFSHVFIDSIMHADVHPFSPWSESNFLLGTIDLLGLHFSLFALGTVGTFWLVLLVLTNKFK